MAFRWVDAMILTGLRTNEPIGGTKRGRTDRLSRVPSPAARRRLVSGAVDPGTLRNALPLVMARAGRECRAGKLIVPHGFRGSFGTWAGKHGYEDALIDIALAHAVSSDVLRRYQRSDKAELRRTMMQGW